MKFFLCYILIVILGSCKATKLQEDLVYKKNPSNKLDSIFVNCGRSSFNLNEISTMWKRDTFGCNGLRNIVNTNDSNFINFILSLDMVEVSSYLGMQNYTELNKNETYFIYIIDSDKTIWCNKPFYRKFENIKYIMENSSYLGLRIIFDANQKVVSFYLGSYGG